jgi:hypothetical protein
MGPLFFMTGLIAVTSAIIMSTPLVEGGSLLMDFTGLMFAASAGLSALMIAAIDN